MTKLAVGRAVPLIHHPAERLLVGSDARLGRLLWDAYTLSTAQLRDTDPVAIADPLRDAMARFAADDVIDPSKLALAKALQHAANRRYTKAGKIFRRLLADGGHKHAAMRMAHAGNKAHQDRVRGGKKTALHKASTQSLNAKRDNQIRAEHSRMSIDGQAPGAAELLAKRFGLTAARIRQIVGPKKRKSR